MNYKSFLFFSASLLISGFCLAQSANFKPASTNGTSIDFTGELVSDDQVITKNERGETKDL